jgi:hypothetical protein
MMIWSTGLGAPIKLVVYPDAQHATTAAVHFGAEAPSVPGI